jgi:hypothetical protein
MVARSRATSSLRASSACCRSVSAAAKHRSASLNSERSVVRSLLNVSHVPEFLREHRDLLLRGFEFEPRGARLR